MRPTRTLLAPLFAMPLLLTACGGASPTPTPAATQLATPAPNTTRSPGPSLSAAFSPSVVVPSGAPSLPAASAAVPGSPTPSPIAFHADPELEARLPVLVEGQGVHVETVPVTSFLGLMDPTSADAHGLRRFLSEVGSDPAAITMAFAGYGSGETAVDFTAYRAPGSRPDHLLAATVYLMRTATGDAAGATVATTQVGNRTVTTVTGTGDDPIAITVHVEGEVAVVTAATGDQLTALLDALP